ncbi:MAG: DNA gyrase C-terminal beta-propeller domain-containing protein [Caldilineaceae bacterium]
MAELSDLTRRDMITAAISLPRIGADQAKGYLFLATALGMVKRVTVADFVGTVANEFSAINVDDKDRLGWVVPTIGGQDIMLVTAAGQSIRFSEEDVRSMGLAAGGVGGIKLKKKDVVIFADAVESDGAGTLMTMTAQGYAKRSDLSEYSRQGRHGGGIVTHKPTGRTGDVVTAIFLDQTMGEEELLAAVTAKQQVKPLTVAEIPIMGRGVQGKQVVELGKSDQMSVLKCLRASTTPGTPDPFNGGHGDGNGNGAVDVASNGSGSTQPSATPTAAGTTARVRSTKSAQRTERSRSVAATSSRAPAAQSRRTATKPTGRSPAAPAENAGIAKATARAQSTSKRKSSPAQSVLIDAKPTSPQKSRPQTTSSSRAQTKPSTAVRSGNVAAKASEKIALHPKDVPQRRPRKQIKPDATAETSQSKRTSTKPSAGRIQSNGTQASSARSGTARKRNRGNKEQGFGIRQIDQTVC